MEVISIDEAEKNFDALFDNIINDIEIKIITRNDEPAAAIMPLNIYNDLINMLNLLQSTDYRTHQKGP